MGLYSIKILYVYVFQPKSFTIHYPVDTATCAINVPEKTLLQFHKFHSH